MEIHKAKLWGMNGGVAWFGVSNVATSINPSALPNNSLTVDEVTKSVTGLTVDALDVSAEIAAIPGGKKLELAHYNAAATSSHKLTTGYIDAGGVFRDLGVTGTTANVAETGDVLCLQVTVTIKIKDSIVSAGYALDTTSTTNVTLAEIVTGVNGQNWDITAARTDHYNKETTYTSGDYYYLDGGVWKQDTAVTNAETFGTQKATHDLYKKTANGSRARFFTTDAESGSDAATSVEVHSDQSLALAVGNSYTATKTFFVYVYGGASGSGLEAEHGTFADAFTITVSA